MMALKTGDDNINATSLTVSFCSAGSQAHRLAVLKDDQNCIDVWSKLCPGESSNDGCLDVTCSIEEDKAKTIM